MAKIIVIVGVFLVAALCSVQLASAQQSCHLRELDLCAATLSVLAQSPNGAASTDAELDKQCVYLRETETCIRNFTMRCSSDQQQELMNIAFDGLLRILNEYCTKGSNIRKSYFKNIPCLADAVKGQKGCINDLQVAFEVVTSVEWDKRIPAVCCGLNGLRTCTVKLIEDKCGKDPVNFLNEVLRLGLSRVPEIVCGDYQPGNKACNDILPPPGSAPKSGRSKSVLSRLLSAYTGL